MVSNKISKIIYSGSFPSKDGKGMTTFSFLESTDGRLYLLYAEDAEGFFSMEVIDSWIKNEFELRHRTYFKEVSAKITYELNGRDYLFRLYDLSSLDKTPMTISEIEERLGTKVAIIG